MIASALHLTRADIKALRITDVYSLHRVVYALFEDIRSEADKLSSKSSGILYVDKGGDKSSRQILILSNRQPYSPEYGKVQSKPIPESFLQYDHYTFEVVINPSKRNRQTGKIVAIRDREEILQWFVDKAKKSWGFTVNPRSLELSNIKVNVFEKKEHVITQGGSTLKGELAIDDRDQFIRSFQQGIGRGRAFGFGLLQIVPLLNPFNF